MIGRLLVVVCVCVRTRAREREAYLALDSSQICIYLQNIYGYQYKLLFFASLKTMAYPWFVTSRKTHF